jgi:L-serine dehydratase
MERISVFDMLKVGIGPSSSHTLGPWRAALAFCEELKVEGVFEKTDRLLVQLFGSLALTGEGHGTDIAVLMGLSGTDPVKVDLDKIQTIPSDLKQSNTLLLAGERSIKFEFDSDIQFHNDQFLPFHSNGLRLTSISSTGELLFEETYYSIGGGFFVKEDSGDVAEGNKIELPFPIDSAEDLLYHCRKEGKPISEIVAANERVWRSEQETSTELMAIWSVMLESLFKGCHTNGELPGGLGVKRRASEIFHKLSADRLNYINKEEWLSEICKEEPNFQDLVKWISAFAMAVNEENANFGRIVTAPTNGSAGVIPAVLAYLIAFCGRGNNEELIINFLMTAAEVGSIFKKGATISAAMGGCQAEIGVSSAMAAAGLTEALGGSPEQCLMAAEIAMEHHLGLTCDPVGGLVQVPCIERNSMGAMKAITATNLALESDPKSAKVSLDKVVNTMFETAKDMHIKYKETSQGGLAIQLSAQMSEC